MYVDPLVCRPDMRESDVIERALEPEIGLARGTLRERGKFCLVRMLCVWEGYLTATRRDSRVLRAAR